MDARLAVFLAMGSYTNIDGSFRDVVRGISVKHRVSCISILKGHGIGGGRGGKIPNPASPKSSFQIGTSGAKREMVRALLFRVKYLTKSIE